MECELVPELEHLKPISTPKKCFMSDFITEKYLNPKTIDALSIPLPDRSMAFSYNTKLGSSS